MHPGDDTPTGLLGGLLGNALPAFQFALRTLFGVQTNHAPIAAEEGDVCRAQLRAFLHHEVCPLTFGQTGIDVYCNGGLSGGGNDPDHIGIGGFAVRGGQHALQIRAFSVAHGEGFAGAHPQNFDMFGIPSGDDQRTCVGIDIVYKKSWHNKPRLFWLHHYATIGTNLQQAHRINPGECA